MVRYTERKIAKCSEKPLVKCRFVHYKFHIDGPWFKLGSSR